jgi:hypothetical protein
MQQTEEIYLPELFPVNIIAKAGIDTGNKFDEQRRIWVLASTEHEDEQDEALVQKAMDISYLPKDGKFLWGHSPPDGSQINPECVIGNVTKAHIPPEGLYAEGILWKGKRYADVIYNDLEQNPEICPHKASIEGSYKILIGPDGIIRKSAVVRNISFDVNVVNTHTMAGVIKSLNGGGRDDCNCHEHIGRLSHDKKKLIGLYVLHEAVCNGKNLKAIKSLAQQYLKLA